MAVPEKISADYTLRPSELASVLALLVKTRQPTITNVMVSSPLSLGTFRLRQEPDRAAGRDREPEPRRGRGEARRSGRSPRRFRR